MKTERKGKKETWKDIEKDRGRQRKRDKDREAEGVHIESQMLLSL